MAVPSFRPGAVCWVDLGTPAPARSAGFYRSLFGWDVADPDGNGYRLCSSRGRLVSALGPAEDPGPPYWTTSIGVPDIAVTVAEFAAAGATIRVPPTRAGTAGVFAVTADPAGTPVSLWQPGTHAGMHAVAEHGTFSAAELLTDALALAGELRRRRRDRHRRAGPPPRRHLHRLPLRHDRAARSGRRGIRPATDRRHHQKGRVMPITVTATRGILTEEGRHQVLPRLTAALIEVSGLRGNAFFASIVGGTVHELPGTDVYAGGAPHPLIMVELKLPDIGLADIGSRARFITEATDIVAALATAGHRREDIWVNILNAPDGGWGIGGTAYTGEALIAAVAAHA